MSKYYKTLYKSDKGALKDSTCGGKSNKLKTDQNSKSCGSASPIPRSMSASPKNVSCCVPFYVLQDYVICFVCTRGLLFCVSM